MLGVYVAAGVFAKTILLNWIVGPLFPFVVLWLVPATIRRLRGGRA